MIDGIDRKVGGKAFGLFRCAPGATKEPVNIRSDLCACVIETEERIKSSALKFSLPHHASATAFIGFVSGL